MDRFLLMHSFARVVETGSFSAVARELGTGQPNVSRYIAALENHLKHVPEDARARILMSNYYAELDRVDDALRELNLAVTLRANEASILYNAACVYCALKRKPEALDTLHKAWEAGYRDSVWTRRDPDLTLLHGDPEFERLYPEKPASAPASGSH